MTKKRKFKFEFVHYRLRYSILFGFGIQGRVFWIDLFKWRFMVAMHKINVVEG